VLDAADAAEDELPATAPSEPGCASANPLLHRSVSADTSASSSTAKSTLMPASFASAPVCPIVRTWLPSERPVTAQRETLTVPAVASSAFACQQLVRPSAGLARYLLSGGDQRLTAASTLQKNRPWVGQ